MATSIPTTVETILSGRKSWATATLEEGAPVELRVLRHMALALFAPGAPAPTDQQFLGMWTTAMDATGGDQDMADRLCENLCDWAKNR
jgi:hypothetical protein